MRSLWLCAAALLLAGSAVAAEPPALARARTLYNAADYDAAIAAAGEALAVPGASDAAGLVRARAHLERFRHIADASDLSAARDALNAIRPASLSPRDQLDLLVGLGQSLYLGDLFGPAAELFDSAIQRATMLAPRDRELLLDWWATALDREAQGSPSDRRVRLCAQLAARMEEELRRDPGIAAANYWRAVARRGAGDIDGAWDAAVAAWVRAPFGAATAAALRADIDRLVTEALIVERARAHPTSEQDAAAEGLRAQWESIKSQYGPY